VGARAPVKYHYLYRFFTYSVERGWVQKPSFELQGPTRSDPSRRHCQVGSLAGAAHLLKDNAGVLRGTH
jgi:hypothetical protein